MDTVAFHLYDLRKTGYIERDEVPSLPCTLYFTMDHCLLDNHPSFSYKLFLLTVFCLFVWVELSGEGDGCCIAVRVWYEVVRGSDRNHSWQGRETVFFGAFSNFHFINWISPLPHQVMYCQINRQIMKSILVCLFLSRRLQRRIQSKMDGLIWMNGAVLSNSILPSWKTWLFLILSKFLYLPWLPPWIHWKTWAH